MLHIMISDPFCARCSLPCSCVRPDYAPLEPNNQSVWAPSGEPVPSAHTRDVVTSLQNSGLLSENSASLLLSRPPSFWNEEERAWYAQLIRD